MTVGGPDWGCLTKLFILLQISMDIPSKFLKINSFDGENWTLTCTTASSDVPFSHFCPNEWMEESVYHTAIFVTPAV